MEKQKEDIKEVKKKESGEESNKEKEADKSDQKTSQNNAGIIFGILAIMLIIVVVLLSMKYYTGSNNFQFEGIKLTKSPLGELVFYKANYPVIAIGVNGPFINAYKEILFREDPRKINYIPVNFSFGLNLVRAGTVYVSMDKDLPACEQNGLAMIDLGRFLSAAGYRVKGAVNDPIYLNESLNTPYVNCDTHPENTVIILKNGNYTQIHQKSPNCYELIFAECDISNVGEKFELEIFKDTIKDVQAIANLTKQTISNSTQIKTSLPNITY